MHIHYVLKCFLLHFAMITDDNARVNAVTGLESFLIWIKSVTYKHGKWAP